MTPPLKAQPDTTPIADIDSRKNVLRVIDGGNNISLADEAEKGGGIMSTLARSTRMGVFALKLTLPAVVLSTGCATVGQQISRVFSSHRKIAYELYQEKDYLEAKHQMQRISENELTDADRELIEKIERAIEAKLKFFLEQTAHFEGGKIMENNYVEVLEYYELAYEYMPSDHPLRSGVKKRITDLGKIIAKLQKKYDEAEATIEKLSSEKDLIKGNHYIKLAAAIYIMQKNAAQLNIDNGRELSELCLDFAKHFSKRNEEKQAVLFFEMAKRLNKKVIPTKGDKDLFASSKSVLKEGEREVEVVQLKGYGREFTELYSAKNPDRKRLLELSYEILEHPYRDELEGDTIVEDATRIKEEEEQKISKAKRAANARARAARARATRARAAAAKKAKSLEGLIETAKAENVKKESKKHQPPQLTEADKANMIKELLDAAEKLFPGEEATELYNEVLKIDPGNSVAKDRLGKIHALRRLKARQSK
ncbi:hypothetical protein KAR91_43450 [Candidatus Pacearchaeota archaeon]|nr:hypothetical protein [Candidatus Pacearchaeota archaeon]